MHVYGAKYTKITGGTQASIKAIINLQIYREVLQKCFKYLGKRNKKISIAVTTSLYFM